MRKLLTFALMLAAIPAGAQERMHLTTTKDATCTGDGTAEMHCSLEAQTRDGKPAKINVDYTKLPDGHVVGFVIIDAIDAKDTVEWTDMIGSVSVAFDEFIYISTSGIDHHQKPHKSAVVFKYMKVDGKITLPKGSSIHLGGL